MLPLAMLLLLSELQAPASHWAVLLASSFQFGQVVQGTVVEHQFILKNNGDALLELSRVSMTSPILATSLPRNVEPGSQVALQFKLDTSSLEGPFDGQILLFLNDPVIPEVRLAFAGQVVRSIEAWPMPAVSLATELGQPMEGSVELINHETAPFRILGIDIAGAKLETRIETMKEGRRYRLLVGVSGGAPLGRRSDTLTVRTSSPTTPQLKITVNTYVHDPVYTFPDTVDLGDLPLHAIQADPGLLERSTQTLMVYQTGGTHFQVSLSTNVPGLVLKSEPGPNGDRWQITIAMSPERIQPGPIRGSIVIRTNDPKHDKLTVPVSGSILDKPKS
jgi:uncharacterized protein DUF1573